MRLLNGYVTKGFLFAFFMAMGILTFAMTGANLVRVFDVVKQGIPLDVFGTIILYMIPRILTFTVPWAVLVAVMLLFGRMSADSEITAMRACGVSIIQIFSPVMIITVLLTLLCVYLQVEVGPPLLGKSRALMTNTAINQPLALFEPGHPVDFQEGSNSTVVAIDDKEGANKLLGVQFCRTDKAGNIQQEISAEYGEVTVNEDTQTLTIKLFNCQITNQKTAENDSVDKIFANELTYSFDYGKQANAERVSNKGKYMRLTDLIGEIRRVKRMKQDALSLEIELNERVVFALSPIAFILLGLPLAIRTSRRETSVGLFISVLLAGTYFMSIILCESLDAFPKLYPQYLIWLPNVAFQVLGAVLTWRISQK